MAISVTGIATATGVTVTSQAITVPAGGVPSGALIVVMMSSGATSGAPTCTDTAGNSYTLVNQTSRNNLASYGYGAMLYAKNAVALSSGNTITITQASGSIACEAVYATGVDTTAPLDTSVTAAAFGNSTAQTVTSGAASVSGDLFVAFTAATGRSTAFTNDTTNGWTAPFGRVSSGGTSGDSSLYSGYQVNAGSGAKTYAPTVTGSSTWAAIVAGFKAAATNINGVLSITEAGDTLASSAGVAVAASASLTEAGDALSGSATVPAQATASLIEASDNVSSAATVRVAGALAASEAADTVAATVTVLSNLFGSASIQEADDTLAASGVVRVVGGLEINEADDTVSAGAAVAVRGAAALLEAADTVAGVIAAARSAVLDAVEAADTVIAHGCLNTRIYAQIIAPCALATLTEFGTTGGPATQTFAPASSPTTTVFPTKTMNGLTNFAPNAAPSSTPFERAAC